MFDCPSSHWAVPERIMTHVVRVESGFNPYAIGVVRGRLARQPRHLAEAVATANMLDRMGYNFSLGAAQVNRYNLRRHGLTSYAKAFEPCANLEAGARILQECYQRAGDWGKAFSCYYSGNFTTGFRHGYVQKVMTGMATERGSRATPIPVYPSGPARATVLRRAPRSAGMGAALSSARPLGAASAVAPVAQHISRGGGDAAFVF